MELITMVIPIKKKHEKNSNCGALHFGGTLGAALSQALRDVERCQEAVRSAKQALQVQRSHGENHGTRD